MTHETDCTCVSCMCFRMESMIHLAAPAIDDAWKAHISTVKSVVIESTPPSIESQCTYWGYCQQPSACKGCKPQKVADLVPPDSLKYDPESPFEKFMRETYMSEQPQLTTKPLNELEIGQRFFFICDPAENPCVYAGESPCGRWFAYWEWRDVMTSVWSIEETADGSEEVICE